MNEISSSSSTTLPQPETTDRDEVVIPIAFDIGMGKKLQKEGKSSIDVDLSALTEKARAEGWTDDAIKEHLIVISPITLSRRLLSRPKGFYWGEGKDSDQPLIEVFSNEQDEMNEILGHELAHATGSVRRNGTTDFGDMLYDRLDRDRKSKAVPAGTLYGAMAGIGIAEVEGLEGYPHMYAAAIGLFALYGAGVGFRLAYLGHPAERRARHAQEVAKQSEPLITIQ